MSFGELHPIFVHFPIVLLAISCFLELAFYIIPNKRTDDFSFYIDCFVYLTLLTLIPTVLTGVAVSKNFPQTSIAVEVHWLLALFTLASVALNSAVRLYKHFDKPLISQKRTLLLNLLCFALLTLAGDVGGGITHKNNFKREKAINFYRMNSIQARSYEPEKLKGYLTKQIGLHEVVSIMNSNRCDKCHSEQFSGGLPTNFSKKMGQSPIWLPRDKEGRLLDWKNSPFYKSVILLNRMPLEEQTPIGLSGSDRLTLLIWLENDAPMTLPQEEEEEEEDEEEANE